ncbi:MAG: DUF2203 domain-containing protein [Bacteroidetes bacterium]|nr:DUF2203 domain-containing protein [Bacteroidota bacterium]
MTTDTKYFTPAEARRTLPLVKKIVRDILDTTKEMRLLADEIGDNAEGDDRIKKMASDVDKFMNELEEIGCYFKDWNFRIGLVDFPGLIDGREVFFCWKSDEEDIEFYHELEEGFTGRKPIPRELIEAK